MAYFDDIEGRVPNRGSIKAENRLFGTANLLAALINRLKNNTSSVSLSIPFLSTFTSIILKTSTLSKTVTSVQSCIGVSQFVVNGANTLTAVCARKRRGINIDDTKDLVEVIAPSQVEPYVFCLHFNILKTQSINVKLFTLVKIGDNRYHSVPKRPKCGPTRNCFVTTRSINCWSN